VSSYNKVLLMGNITRDVEVRYTPNTNTAIANLGLAVNRKWKDQSGQMKEEVTFVDVEAFGKTAENIAKFFGKGKPIFIEGRLKLDQWDDKNDGSKRSKLKVIAESFEFIGGDRSDAPATAPASRPATARPQQKPDDIDEDSIPF